MKLKKILIFILCIFLIMLIGIIDFYTNENVSIAFFYLIPISISSWYCNREAGIFVALISTVTWFIVDIIISSIPRHPLIPYWNGIMQMGFFLINSILISMYKKLLDKEKQLARIDKITGIYNRHAFYESATLELERARRYQYPMTVGFLDIDNFKKINDRFGHNKGDEILNNVAKAIKNNTRKNDVLARIGGDEFVLLLPDVDMENSRIIFSKIRNLISESSNNVLYLTASIGVVTFRKIPDSVEDLLAKADSSMYLVKNSFKNDVKYDLF